MYVVQGPERMFKMKTTSLSRDTFLMLFYATVYRRVSGNTVLVSRDSVLGGGGIGLRGSMIVTINNMSQYKLTNPKETNDEVFTR